MKIKSYCKKLKSKYEYQQLERELNTINKEIRELFLFIRDGDNYLAKLEVPSKLLAFHSRIIEIIKILKKMNSEISSLKSEIKLKIYETDKVKNLNTIKEKDSVVNFELKPLNRLEDLVKVNIDFGYDMISLIEKSYFLLKQMAYAKQETV